MRALDGGWWTVDGGRSDAIWTIRHIYPTFGRFLNFSVLSGGKHRPPSTDVMRHHQPRAAQGDARADRPLALVTRQLGERAPEVLHERALLGELRIRGLPVRRGERVDELEGRLHEAEMRA